MDYEALERVVAVPPSCWNELHVKQWLEFVHLHPLIPAFTAHRINGSALLKLAPQHLSALGINNSIIQRKLMRWVKEGFYEYEQHLAQANGQNKENIPPFQRKNTTQREVPKPKPKKTAFQSKEDDSFVIRSCDGNLAAFCVMKEQSLKIGRAPMNTIRTLEVSVENEHAEIFKLNGKHYIRDLGTQAGTFLKISQPRILQHKMLIEMGSFLMEVKQICKELKVISLSILHMISKQICELTISLQEGCSFYSFGRRKTNNFAFDDEHLSGIHAKIFMLHNEFVIEDQHSTNGTWLRLSLPSQPSISYALQECSVFKVGTTITYQCDKQKQNDIKMQVQYDDTCVSCLRQKKNILMVPCRHNVVCFSCAEHLSHCPSCNSPIDEKIKIYI